LRKGAREEAGSSECVDGRGAASRDDGHRTQEGFTRPVVGLALRVATLHRSVAQSLLHRRTSRHVPVPAFVVSDSPLASPRAGRHVRVPAFVALRLTLRRFSQRSQIVGVDGAVAVARELWRPFSNRSSVCCGVDVRSEAEAGRRVACGVPIVAAGRGVDGRLYAPSRDVASRLGTALVRWFSKGWLSWLQGGERGARHRLTECQAVRVNASTLTCWLVRSGAWTAERGGSVAKKEGPCGPLRTVEIAYPWAFQRRLRKARLSRRSRKQAHGAAPAFAGPSVAREAGDRKKRLPTACLSLAR